MHYDKIITDTGLNYDVLPSLVGFWSGQNISGSTLYDRSYYKNNGIIYGSVPPTPQSVNGLGINLSVATRIDFGNSDNYSFTDGTKDIPFTITFFLDKTGMYSGGSYATFLSKWNKSSSKCEWRCGVSGQVLAFSIGNAGSTNYEAYAIPIPSTKYTKVTWTYNGLGVSKIYYNGVSVESTGTHYNNGYDGVTAGRRMVRDSSLNACIGNYSDSSLIDYSPNCVINDIRLYKGVVLSQREIKKIQTQ